MIPFNVPVYDEKGIEYIKDAASVKHHLGGDGYYTGKSNAFMEQKFHADKVLLTTSCTHALEMAAILCDIGPTDEVITTSFTFVSTVNAFVLRGAKIRFIDIRPDTLNMDEELLEEAITPRTKAIIPVHYAGISCNMNRIQQIAERHHISVIEDAAQGVMSKYQGKYLGTIGDLGCYSFHETKNFTMGEGGALVINNKKYQNRAEIVREKGTNRSSYLRGEIDKYSWIDLGSSYLPGEMNAAYLYAQLEDSERILMNRRQSYEQYQNGLWGLMEYGAVELPVIPQDCESNAHIFYIKVKDVTERRRLMQYLLEHGIQTASHYVPLHTSPAGKLYGSFIGEDRYTTRESERVLRLPLYYGISRDEVDFVIQKIYDFYQIK